MNKKTTKIRFSTGFTSLVQATYLQKPMKNPIVTKK